MKLDFSKVCLLAGVAAAFSCVAQEQGSLNPEGANQLTDRFRTITLTVPSKWHDETEQRLADIRAAEAFRGDSGGHVGRELLLAIKKDAERRPGANAGCMFFSWKLPPSYPETLETSKLLVERVANDLHESYKKAQLADYLRRGLSVSAFHSNPQQVALEKSQEVRIGDHSGWEQLWKVTHERARDPLISITAAVLLNTRQMEKEHTTLIVQCTFTGEESRTFWGDKSPEERVHDMFNTVRIGDAPR